jgi:NAD-dependent dihydropyrimidine dehydrogenase PreA subunit
VHMLIFIHHQWLRIFGEKSGAVFTLRRRNRGRGKYGKMIRRYPVSHQIPQYQGLRYNYPPFYSGSSRLVSSQLPDSHTKTPLKGEISNKIPIVDWNRCVGCGTCVQNCPVGAIELIAEKVHIDSEKCIRCGLCFELCPRNAIS